jgi:hypothetical protein
MLRHNYYNGDNYLDFLLGLKTLDVLGAMFFWSYEIWFSIDDQLRT